MNTETKKLFIDAIAYRKGKAYGYNEYLFNLLEYFYSHREDIKYDEVILVINKSQRESFIKFLDKFKIKELRCDGLIMNAINQAIWNISKEISSRDLILSTGNYTTIWPKGTKVVVFHDLLYKHTDITSLGLKKYQREVFVPASIKQASTIICISNFTENEVLKYYPFAKGKTITIYNYLNYQKFHKKECNSRTGFVSIASAAPHKNTVFVLKAFEQYVLMGGKQNLSIVGSANNQMIEVLNKMSEDVRKRIFIFSHISNTQLADLYSQNKFYVSASKFEGLGMPIAEAMYFKMFLILPDQPEIYHEISKGNAFFFKNAACQNLVDTMIYADSIIEDEFCHDISQFSIDETSRKYIELFNSFY